MTPFHHQRGSTLLIALIMLVLLTLIAVSAMSTTTVSLQAVGNAQFLEEAQAAGQRAIENVLSNGDFRNTPPVPQSIDINQDGTPDYTVTFAPPPACLSYRKALPTDPNYPVDCIVGAGLSATCYWTTWDITANVTDAVTGANVILHQGVRTIAGLNAAVNFCGV